MHFSKAYTYLMGRLEQELPEHLSYHNAAHTRQVVETTKELAQKEDLPDAERPLLYTAALFHDAGFLEGYTDHEALSCKVARTVLPRFDYDAGQIERVCQLIMATRLPQHPTSLAEQIICDADLYYLGTDDFMRNAGNLFKEFRAVGAAAGWDAWRGRQIAFLESHHFFTQSARKACAEKKAQNLHHLKATRQPAKAVPATKVSAGHMQDLFFLVGGSLLTAFALKGFLIPNNFLDGGIMGFSILLHKYQGLNFPLVLLLANLPFMIAGFFYVSRAFAYKTLFAVGLIGLMEYFLPFSTISTDHLLIPLFGGLFLGLGVGLVMRAGGAADGIEVLALYTIRKTSFTITEVILAINVVLFAAAATVFGIEKALYSILVYIIATKTIDYVVEGFESQIGVTIISGRGEQIKHRLVNELGRGITVYKGERGFLPGSYEVSTPCDIIFTVVSRLEMRRLKNIVQQTDGQAFVFASTIREAQGGLLRHHHHH